MEESRSAFNILRENPIEKRPLGKPRRRWEDYIRMNIKEIGSIREISYIREECRLKVFENRILRQIFGPKGDENGDWRRLHKEDLNCLYLIMSG